MDLEKAKDTFKDDDFWFEGGKGDSFKNAVIIGTDNHALGVFAEKHFISSRFGQEGSDWHFIEQEFFIENNRAYDAIIIGLSDGSFEKVYFDISEFYGNE